jgi:hypothetical protein
MRILNNILTEINAALLQNLNGLDDYGDLGSRIQFWGEASLHEQDGKTFPVVNEGDGDGRIISFDDDYALQIYHRVLDIENIELPDEGFGASVKRFRDMHLRLVGIGIMSKFTERTWETNTDIMSIVYQAIPVDLTYEFLMPGDEQPDKMAVMAAEFTNHEYDHLKFDLIAFWIEYTVRQRSDCGTISNDPLVTINDLAGITGYSTIYT